MNPTFINVGPGRCGTSWLMEMLAGHPDIEMARIKETEFFNNNYEKGKEWYLEKFPNEAKAVGEISNMYYLDSEVPARIANFDPKMKIIFNVRDPQSLMASMVSFAMRRGIDVEDVTKVLDEPIAKVMGSGYPQRLAAGELSDGDKVTLREAVLMSRYIERFRESFPDEQIYFLAFERIATDPKNLLAELYDFLGVDSQYVPPGLEEKVNAAIQPRVRWLGKLIPKVSYAMRRVGAEALLARLHRSRLIKKVIYRERQSAGLVNTGDLSADDQAALEEERDQLLSLVPNLQSAWS